MSNRLDYPGSLRAVVDNPLDCRCACDVTAKTSPYGILPGFWSDDKPLPAGTITPGRQVKPCNSLTQQEAFKLSPAYWLKVGHTHDVMWGLDLGRLSRCPLCQLDVLLVYCVTCFAGLAIRPPPITFVPDHKVSPPGTVRLVEYPVLPANCQTLCLWQPVLPKQSTHSAPP